MRVGDAGSALALPAISALALSMRDSEDARAAQAKSVEVAIASSLGPRLKEPAKLHALLQSATKARSDVFALALSVDDSAPHLVLRGPLRDAVAANDAMRGVVDLARVEPFKDLFRLRDITLGSEDTPTSGKVTVATFARDSHARAGDTGAPSAAANVGIAWSVRDGHLVAFAGPDPSALLSATAGAERTLADEPSLKRFAADLGSEASTVIVAQPLRLDPKRASLPPAPLGVAVGKKGGDAFVRVDIADALLREGARWAMGF
jgi:hypothetical protein